MRVYKQMFLNHSSDDHCAALMSAFYISAYISV